MNGWVIVCDECEDCYNSNSKTYVLLVELERLNMQNSFGSL